MSVSQNVWGQQTFVVHHCYQPSEMFLGGEYNIPRAPPAIKLATTPPLSGQLPSPGHELNQERQDS